MTGNDLLRSVVIVGGGTAGWLSAAVLRAYLDALALDITVVESPDIPIIGVGEATVPPLVDLFRRIGISEERMMRACSATWKLGIRFDDWHGPGSSYWHPFGIVGGSVDGLPFYYYWLRHRLATRATEFTDFSPNAEVARRNRAPIAAHGRSEIIERGFYAWHLDAVRLATFLREICIDKGVRHVADEVVHVECGAAGIESIVCRDAGTIEADLYLDCSGFSALLAEGALHDSWQDWSRLLLCDRAVTLPLAPDGNYPPFTRARALDAGWAWTIPLYDRTGCGYVYSSRHIDDDEALDALTRHTGASRIAGEPRFLPMRVGRRLAFWRGNCVAVGLAAGFLEPLESTGIYFVQESLEQLLRYFPGRTMNPALIERYNERMANTFDDVRDFILLHYLLSGRDGEFWTQARNVPPGDDLRAAITLHDATAMVEKPVASLFGAQSVQTILAGNGHLPEAAPPQARRVDLASIERILDEIRQRNDALAESLSDHDAVLQRLHGIAP
ncbi:MAG: tryptophan 7-halogenase [Proteobacteria bacterium]|nr:MAG: tryptophan 7-halogenase [Pseudomonadota bacterium]